MAFKIIGLILFVISLVQCQQPETLKLEERLDAIAASYKASLSDLKNTAKALEKEILTLHSSRPFEPAGFTAYASLSRYLLDGETVPFDGFILDKGNHFDLLTNRFTCPRTGIYYVNYNLRREFGDVIHVYAVLESRVILGSHSYDDSSHYDSTVSNSGVVRCFTGQQIWMRSDAETYIHGAGTQRWNTFSVYLMIDEGQS